MTAQRTPAEQPAAAQALESALIEVRGNPTATELAALVTVLAAASGPPAAQREPSVPSRWRDPLAAVRRPWHARRGAWPAGSWGRV